MRGSSEVRSKPVVVMYYAFGNKVGGPLTYINTIINSEMRERYDFRTCYQNKAPGGVDLRLLKKMTQTLRQIKPDIVHVQGAQSEGFYGVLAAKFAGCKHIVMTVHGFAHDDLGYRGVKRILYKHIVEPLSLRLSDQVYCVCQAASERKIVRRNAGKRNRGYIHNPVPVLTVKQTRQAIRSRYGVQDEDVLFCIAGRLTKDKGFDLLAEIVQELNRRENQKFRLLVMGDGDYRTQFCQTLQKEIASGQVIMVGNTDDVASYLAASDAFVFPSYHENLSIALLEACASGLPCIVGNVGGNTEIIHNGKNGIVIDSFSRADYADAIEYLIENSEQRKQMQAFAKTDIQERFSLKKMCHKIDEVYSNHVRKR